MSSSCYSSFFLLLLCISLLLLLLPNGSPSFHPELPDSKEQGLHDSKEHVIYVVGAVLFALVCASGVLVFFYQRRRSRARSEFLAKEMAQHELESLRYSSMTLDGGVLIWTLLFWCALSLSLHGCHLGCCACYVFSRRRAPLRTYSSSAGYSRNSRGTGCLSKGMSTQFRSLLSLFAVLLVVKFLVQSRQDGGKQQTGWEMGGLNVEFFYFCFTLGKLICNRN